MMDDRPNHPIFSTKEVLTPSTRTSLLPSPLPPGCDWQEHSPEYRWFAHLLSLLSCAYYYWISVCRYVGRDSCDHIMLLKPKG